MPEWPAGVVLNFELQAKVNERIEQTKQTLQSMRLDVKDRHVKDDKQDKKKKNVKGSGKQKTRVAQEEWLEEEYEYDSDEG